MVTQNSINEPTAASGKVLQGQGVGTASAFSTATYPSSSGGTGKILYDNGTNFVESTPTFPASASETTRKIIVSDGTNWVASTETYATPGTSGNVMTSDGTNWTSAAGGTGTVTSVSGTANQVAVATGTTTPVISLIGPYTPATYTAHGVLIGEGTSSIVALAAGSAGQVLQSGGASADPAYSTATYPSTAGTTGNVLTSDGTNFTSSTPALLQVTKALTNAQIKALHATPVQLVAAPGAGKVIVVVRGLGKMIYGGTNVFTAGASQSVAAYYGTTQLAYGDLVGNAGLVASASNYYTGFTQALSNVAIATLENVALNLYNPIATEITGNAANNNTIDVTVVYFIATL